MVQVPPYGPEECSTQWGQEACEGPSGYVDSMLVVSGCPSMRLKGDHGEYHAFGLQFVMVIHVAWCRVPPSAERLLEQRYSALGVYKLSGGT